MTKNQVKDVLKMMPYGIYSVTSKYGDKKNAMVANWITQVSFDPRFIAIAVQKTSFTHGLIEKGKVFAINIFNKADIDSIKPFTKGRSKNPDKMKGTQ